MLLFIINLLIIALMVKGKYLVAGIAIIPTVSFALLKALSTDKDSPYSGLAFLLAYGLAGVIAYALIFGVDYFVAWLITQVLA